MKKSLDTNQKERKQNALFKAVRDVFRRLSITVTLTVYSIYLIYFIYSLAADVGVKAINVVLIALTAAFMAVYLVLRLSETRKSSEIKQIKQYYKRVKLIARAITSITAVYALITAASSVNPFALIVAILGAVFVVIRLIVELISYLIQRKLKEVKQNYLLRSSVRMKMKNANSEGLPHDRTHKKKAKRKSKLDIEKPRIIEDLEEKIIPLDECLLSDIELL